MAGRKEILTKQVAKQICSMIGRMPDAEIPVTWENVMAHARKKVGHGFNRQMLSQKEWDGHKLIAEAFREAKGVQSRMRNDSTPKYKTAPRAVLQKRIADLEASNLTLREELEKVRAQQMDVLDAFLNTPRNLCVLIDEAVCQERSRTAPVDELKAKRIAAKIRNEEGEDL
jgi:hypothetical protein